MPSNLSAKELTALDEQLSFEQLLIKKYRSLANFCNDPSIRAKCGQIASKHQEHYDRLIKYLG